MVVRGRAPAKALRGQAARGFFWLLGQTVGSKLVSVVGQVVLAWLIRPEDFGLIASAYTISGIAGVIQQGGLREILIQRPARLKRWANPAFWMALLLSTISGVLTLALAPLAARLFHSPHVIGLLAVIAVSMPLSALSVVQNAMVQVQLRFRLQAVLGFLTLGLGTALSIFFAWRNFGAYSFVLPMPIVALARSLVLWLATRSSLRGAVRWSLQLRRWRFLWLDNWLLMGFAVCSAITLQGDYFTLSVMHSKTVVGVYYFAFNLATQTIQLVGMNLAGVLFPTLSQLRSEPQRQLRAFMSAMRLLAFAGVPACFLQAALADPGMRLLFHAKWVAAIPVVQILSIGMAWLLFGWQAGALLQAQRRLNVLLRYGVASVFIFLGLVYIGSRLGEAAGVAVAVSIAFMILAILSFCMATIPMGARPREVARLFLVPMILSAVAVAPVALLAWFWAPRAPLGEIACLGVGTAIATTLYAWLLHRFEPETWDELRRSVLKARKTAPPTPIGSTPTALCPICHVESGAVKRITRPGMIAWMRQGLHLEMPTSAMETDYTICRCPRCTLEFADPMLPGNSAFYHWLAAQRWYFPVNRWEWDLVIENVRDRGCKTLLEVGCGSGIFLKRLNRRLDIRAIGLDLTEGVVKSCVNDGLEVYEGAVEGFAQQYGNRAGPVGCAVAFHCLEHVPDPLGFVRSMAELVGPGGLVFVSTPYSPMGYERMWPDPLNYPPHHMTRWNEKAYRQLAAELGLEPTFYMPTSGSLLTRVARGFALLNRTQTTQRSRLGKLMKMLSSPLELSKEIRHQLSRDRVNGQPASDIVLVQFRVP